MYYMRRVRRACSDCCALSPRVPDGLTGDATRTFTPHSLGKNSPSVGRGAQWGRGRGGGHARSVTPLGSNYVTTVVSRVCTLRARARQTVQPPRRVHSYMLALIRAGHEAREREEKGVLLPAGFENAPGRGGTERECCIVQGCGRICRYKPAAVSRGGRSWFPSPYSRHRKHAGSLAVAPRTVSRASLVQNPRPRPMDREK